MQRLIVLDTETTGLSPHMGHKVVEIGCIEIIDRKITNNSYHVYINPNRKVPYDAFKLHGLSNEFLNDKPFFSEILDDFVSYISDSPLIFHNAPFDMRFLKKEFLDLNKEVEILEGNRVINDTLVLARNKFPGKKNNLNALCDRFNINRKKRNKGHGALIDAELTAEVYLKITHTENHSPSTRSKDKYIGDTKNSSMNGQVTQNFVNRDEYAEERKDSLKNRHGTFTFSNGDKYVGEWKDGSKNGQGTYTYADGSKYEGEWKDGEKHGQGTFIYTNGDKYVGEWKDGLKNGQGINTRSNGSKYVGEYKDGNLHGQGIYTFEIESNWIYPSIEKYIGNLNDAKRHGQGIMTRTDGSQYIGEYEDDLFHGLGTYIFSNGAIYMGVWKNGQQHGQGTYFFPKEGTLEYPDGAKYIGDFEDDKFHGFGKLIYTDGCEDVGEWENGKFKEYK